MIRSRRRDGEPVEEPLQELYRFATLYDLVHPPREPEADQPIDAAKWEEVEHLELPYRDVGYERLTLLKKTDRKWLVEAWGEPNAHLLPVARRQPRTAEGDSTPEGVGGDSGDRGREGAEVGDRSRGSEAHEIPGASKGSEEGGVPQAEAVHDASPSKRDEPEDADGVEQVEVYRPPSRAAFEAALAPRPRHTYDGGAVPVPEGHEDPVYDLMERLAKPSAGTKRRRKAKLLKRALALTGFSSDD